MYGQRESRWQPIVVGVLITLVVPSASVLAMAQLPAASPVAACEGVESQLHAAQKALDQGDLAVAQQLLTPLQSSHGDCSEVLVGLGRLHAARNDPITAQQLFSRASVLAPHDARPYYYLAQLQFSQQEYRQADYFSNQALALDPADPAALILRGQILVMKRQTAAAQELLEKACKLDPNNPEAHFQLGVFFDGRQLHPEAVEQFEKVVALRPNDPRAFDYLALNLESLGEPKKAEAAYLKALQVNEGPFFDSFLDYNYGRFLMKANRLAESKVRLDRALRISPETRAVYYEHSRLNLRMQKYKDAQVDAERALSIPDPSGFILDLQVYYLLATIYSRLGNTELAQKYAALCRTSRVPIQSQGRGER